MERVKRKKLAYYIVRMFLSLSLGVIALASIYGVVTYPRLFAVKAAFVQPQIVESEEKLVVEFDKAVLPDWKTMNISTFPSEKIILKWEEGNRKLVISPVDYWKPQTKYTLTISNGKTILLTSVNLNFSFEVRPYPEIESFYPLDGEKDIVVDMEDPISVTFDKSLKNYAVKFVVNPTAEMVYEMDESKKSIKLLPKSELLEGKNYTVDVYIRHKKETPDLFNKIYSSSFQTKIFLTPDKWEKDPSIKLEQALRYTVPLVKEGKYIDVNLDQQIMVLFENGKAVSSYLISSGKRGMETPKGNFQIHNKAERVWSKKYALYMPYWMAILPSGLIGIHELPEWPGGYKEGANHLGLPVSHGCIRLGVGAAKHVFEWSNIGTSVIVH